MRDEKIDVYYKGYKKPFFMLSSVNLGQKFFQISETVHLRIFGHEMGEEMRLFLRNLSWSFFGGIIASTLMMGVNIGIGRYFGPEEYGKYNIVLILSQFLLILIYLGTDVSSVKFLSEKKDQLFRKSFFSSSFYFVLIMIFLSWISYFLFHSKIELYFGVDNQYLILGIFLGSALAIKGMVDGYLRSYFLFRFQAISRIIEAVIIIFCLFLTLWLLDIREYQYYIYVLSGGAGVFSLLALFRLRKNFVAFRWASLKLMLSYGSVILAGAFLSIVFNSLDKIIVAKYLGVAQLGVYSAYFVTATSLVAQMTQVFNNVFFPAISQVENIAYVEKINTLIKWFFIPGGIFLSLVLYGIVLIFGDAYEPDIFLAMGFGFLAVFQIILTVNGSIITALSKSLLKRYYFWLYGISFLHILSYGILIYFELTTIPFLLFLFFINFGGVILIQKRIINTFIREKMVNS